MKNETTPPAFPELDRLEAAYREAQNRLEALANRRAETKETLEEANLYLSTAQNVKKRFMRNLALNSPSPELDDALAKNQAEIDCQTAKVQEAENFLSVFDEAEMEHLYDLSIACGNYNEYVRQTARAELAAAQKKLFEALAPHVAQVRMWKSICDQDRTPSPTVRSELAGLLALDQIAPAPAPFGYKHMNHVDSQRLDRWQRDKGKAKGAERRAKEAGSYTLQNPSEDQVNTLSSRRPDFPETRKFNADGW